MIYTILKSEKSGHKPSQSSQVAAPILHTKFD